MQDSLCDWVSCKRERKKLANKGRKRDRLVSLSPFLSRNSAAPFGKTQPSQKKKKNLPSNSIFPRSLCAKPLQMMKQQRWHWSSSSLRVGWIVVKGLGSSAARMRCVIIKGGASSSSSSWSSSSVEGHKQGNDIRKLPLPAISIRIRAKSSLLALVPHRTP